MARFRIWATPRTRRRGVCVGSCAGCSRTSCAPAGPISEASNSSMLVGLCRPCCSQFADLDRECGTKMRGVVHGIAQLVGRFILEQNDEAVVFPLVEYLRCGEHTLARAHTLSLVDEDSHVPTPIWRSHHVTGRACTP